MLSDSVFQVIVITTDLIIIIFVWYYLWELRSKQKELEKKEDKVDTNYHQIVDDALSRERKILDDATQEANQIITQAQYVNTSSKDTVDQALQKMIGDIKNETTDATREFKESYVKSLGQISTNSLGDFHKVIQDLQVDLKQQVKQVHDTLLPNLEKELERYKEDRLKQSEQTITHIVQKVSQEVLNKSISFDDHQRLMLESLEKAKKEGLFE